MSLLSSIQGMGGSFFGGNRSMSNITGEIDKLGNAQSMADIAKTLGGESGTKGVDASKLLGNFSVENLQKAVKNQVDRMGATPEKIGENSRSVFADVGMGGREAPSFASMLTGFVDSVDAKSKASEQAASDLMLGKSDNIHQAMIAMQEASISFDLLVQVRNKLVESYKELSRIQA